MSDLPRPEVVEREAACLVDWLALPAGAAIGVAGLPAPHREALVSRGFLVREVRPSLWLDGPTGQRPAPADALDGIVLLDQPLWSYWEVEEIHRLRVRRLAELLRPGGRLVFGGRETLGRADLERARLLEDAERRVAEGAQSPPSLRRGRFTHYSPIQARVLLAQCGFELERFRNGLDGDSVYRFDGPGMFFICRRV